MRNFFNVAIILAITVSMPILASAQWDEVNIYANPEGNLQELVGLPGVPFSAYVVLINPNAALIWGFEFGYTFIATDPAAMFRLQATLPPQAVDVGNSNDVVRGDYVVGLASPLVGAQAVVLVEWQFMLSTPQTVFMELGPANNPSLPLGLPVYETGGTLVAMGLAPTCWGTEVRVNEFCPTAVDEQTFGAVKALYR